MEHETSPVSTLKTGLKNSDVYGRRSFNKAYLSKVCFSNLKRTLSNSKSSADSWLLMLLPSFISSRRRTNSCFLEACHVHSYFTFKVPNPQPHWPKVSHLAHTKCSSWHTAVTPRRRRRGQKLIISESQWFLMPTCPLLWRFSCGMKTSAWIPCGFELPLYTAGSWEGLSELVHCCKVPKYSEEKLCSVL